MTPGESKIVGCPGMGKRGVNTVVVTGVQPRVGVRGDTNKKKKKNMVARYAKRPKSSVIKKQGGLVLPSEGVEN